MTTLLPIRYQNSLQNCLWNETYRGILPAFHPKVFVNHQNLALDLDNAANSNLSPANLMALTGAAVCWAKEANNFTIATSRIQIGHIVESTKAK